MHLAPDLTGQFARARRLPVGNGDETYRRMLGREPCAQRADAARADDGEAQVFSFKSDDALLLEINRKTTQPLSQRRRFLFLPDAPGFAEASSSS